MKNKILATIIFLVLVGGGGYMLVGQLSKEVKAPETQRQALPPSPDQSSKTPASAKTEPSVPSSDNKKNPASGTYSSGEEFVEAPNISVILVSFDGRSFAPAEAKIQAGDYVFFRNDGPEEFWVIAPPQAGWDGFDSGQALAAGKQYKYQFTTIGSYTYQDKISGATGTVIVDKQ